MSRLIFGGHSLFDSHCHFDFSTFDGQRESLWSECVEVGISRLLIPGVGPQQWPKAYAIAQKYEGIVMAAGLHPWYVSDTHSSTILHNVDEWVALLQRRECVAIGECGLDKLIAVPLEKQQKVFEAHLAMAADCGMPLIIHVRQTHNETIRLLKKYTLANGGVIHGFTGSKELAMEYWRMGFYLGIGGSITYPRANKTRRMVQAMPLESLLLETDAPDMPLSAYQGEANSPLKLVEVAIVLSQLREQTLEHVVEQTTINANKVFCFSHGGRQ